MAKAVIRIGWGVNTGNTKIQRELIDRWVKNRFPQAVSWQDTSGSIRYSEAASDGSFFRLGVIFIDTGRNLIQVIGVPGLIRVIRDYGEEVRYNWLTQSFI